MTENKYYSQQQNFNFQDTHVNDDIALIRVSRDVIFTSNLIPICLPFGELFPDTQGAAFVAGWGLKEDIECTTGNYFYFYLCSFLLW